MLVVAALSTILAVADDNPCPADLQIESVEIECVEYTREKAEQGDAGAQNNIGVMYYKGEGVERDYGEAYIWLSISNAGGVEQADEVLQKTPWQQFLTPEEIKSAKNEAFRRFAEIVKRKNNAQNNN